MCRIHAVILLVENALSIGNLLKEAVSYYSYPESQTWCYLSNVVIFGKKDRRHFATPKRNHTIITDAHFLLTYIALVILQVLSHPRNRFIMKSILVLFAFGLFVTQTQGCEIPGTFCIRYGAKACECNGGHQVRGISMNSNSSC